MKELIIYFSHNRTDAYYLQKTGQSFAVLDYHRYKDDESFGQFLKKLKVKQARAVLEDHETVVKGITTPILYSEDIESFVTNNINEYFVLDPNDYEVDYRITAMDKKVKELHVMLTAAKKDHIAKVKAFFSIHKIKLSGLSVMPEVLVNLLQKEEKKSTAVIRVHGKSAWIHIEREKNVFLHTALDYEEIDETPSESTIDNISYYLNFYSKQYFGETIDRVIIQAEIRYEKKLKEVLGNIYDGEIISLAPPSFKIKDEALNLQPEEAWLLGAYPTVRPVFDKTINYAAKRSRYIVENRKKSVLKLAVSLVLVTVLLQGGFMLLENYMKSFYSTDLLQIPEDRIVEVNETLKEVRTYEEGLMNKAKILNDIQNESIDFMAYLNALQVGVPREVKIDQIYFSAAGIDVNFYLAQEETRTLDAARLMLALNDTGLFKPVKLDALNMDNTQEFLQLNLVYITSESDSVPADEGSEGITDGN